MRTRSAVIMVTRRCNMACAHCSVESHPGLKSQPDPDDLRRLVDSLLQAGVVSLQFTGGEPLLRQDLVLELMHRAKAAGVKSSIVSNGFWGKKPEVAERTFDALREAGLARLAISYDRFHAEFQGPEPVLNILRVAQQRDFPLHINITRTADDRDLDRIVAPFHGQPHARLRFYDIQPVGNARALSEELRAELDGYCSSCEFATFTDNGRMIACNGPAYFEKSDSGLVVGKFSGDDGESIAGLLDRHGGDPILETIRTEGPARLRQILESLPGFENYPFKPVYRGMCELCLEINRDTRAVAALREFLSSDQQAAWLVAKRRVRDQARRLSYNRDGANDGLGPAILLRWLLGQTVEGSDKILGRADLDWHRLMERLRAAGLLHLFATQRVNPGLSRWAPHFFWLEAEADAGEVEAVLEQRREDVRQALLLARQAGFLARPVGSTAVLLAGGRRIPQRIFLAADNGDALRRLLQTRLNLSYHVEVLTSHPISSTASVPLELLAEWRRGEYREGLETIWDLHTACHKDGLEAPGPFLAECQVLLEDFALPIGSIDRRRPLNPAHRLAVRAIRHLMFRDPYQRTNLFIGPALPLLTVQSVRHLPEAVMLASWRLHRALKALADQLHLRGALRRAWRDLNEAYSAARSTLHRQVFRQQGQTGQATSPSCLRRVP